MPLKSDLTLNATLFDPANVSEETKRFNAVLKMQMKGLPTWVDTGAARYRKMRLNGETALPAPIVLPGGTNVSLPSRGNHEIPCRYFAPKTYQPDSPATSIAPKGIFMHIHGGGWVLFDEKSTDTLLNFYAEQTGCLVISVGYRLAPEDPWPKGVEDVEDAAQYLVENGRNKGWGDLRYIGGESAGAHLSLLAAYHLLRTKPDFRLPGGLILHFPATDLSHAPSAYSIPNAPILEFKDIKNFADAFLPGMSFAERKQPRVSPLYEDLNQYRGRLPRMLATCGTNDPLLDDSVFMAAKWQMAGGDATLKIYKGAPHGFISFPGDMFRGAVQGLADVVMWFRDGEAAEVETADGQQMKKLKL